jgi:hypothetical protein
MIDEDWLAADRTKCAHRTIDAAGDDLAGASEQLLRAREIHGKKYALLAAPQYREGICDVMRGMASAPSNRVRSLYPLRAGGSASSQAEVGRADCLARRYCFRWLLI